MNFTTVIPTDLITPLGAYLRLREEAPASFLLESVEHGRLGRYSWVGAGSQIVDLADAEGRAEPVVGYLSYDHIAKLEPTVHLPSSGPDLPESRFIVVGTLVRFDHARGIAEVLSGDAEALGELLDAPHRPIARSGGAKGATRRLPSRFEYERGVKVAKEHIRAGDAFQIVLSQRAERPTSASALDLYRSLRHGQAQMRDEKVISRSVAGCGRSVTLDRARRASRRFRRALPRFDTAARTMSP